MPRNSDREDFLTDYDPSWGNDNERDWEDDEPGRDVPEMEDDEVPICTDCQCDPEDPDPLCECPCHKKVS